MVSSQTLRGSSSNFSRSQLQVSQTPSDSFVQDIMNDMSIHFGLGGNYNPDFVKELRTCMAKWDGPNDASLERAVDAHWRGIVSYSNNSTDNDPWVNCLEEPSHERCKSSKYKEGQQDMAALFGDGMAREMVVEEPCNYASNIAYYHGALRICNRNSEEWSGGDSAVAIRNALKRSFVTLAGGSAFWHASETKLGGKFDTVSIATISYISYESLIDAIGGSSKLRCLSEEPCTRSEEVAQRLASLPLDYSLSLDAKKKTGWQNELESIEKLFPHDYYKTFAATVAIAAYICFPDNVAKLIVDGMAGQFGLESFINEEVLRDAKPLIEGLDLKWWQEAKLSGGFIGSITKISYAFLFQEDILTEKDFNSLQFAFGVDGVAALNGIGDFFSGNSQTAFPLATGASGAYPGHQQCNTRSAHALWHQESAEGLSELNFFVDSIIRVIENQCPDDGSLEGCRSDQYCKFSGTNNKCVAKKGTGQTCLKDLVCTSNDCSAIGLCNQCPSAGSLQGCPSGQYCKWSGTNNKCVANKGTGQSCSKDLVCASNDCSRSSRCNQCPSAGSRTGCPGGQYCKWSGTNNKCVGLKPRRGTCSSGTVCQSNKCRFGFCTKP